MDDFETLAATLSRVIGIILFGGLACKLLFDCVAVRRLRIERRDQAFAERSAQRAWTYASGRSAAAMVRDDASNLRDARDVVFAFRGGRPALSWQMWYDNGRRFAIGGASAASTAAPRAVWFSSAVTSTRLRMMILPRCQLRLALLCISPRVVRRVVRSIAAFLGLEGDPDRAGDFVAQGVETADLAETFRRRFAVVVGPEDPREWFDDRLQEMLLVWPHGDAKVAASLGSYGVRIAVEAPPIDDWSFWQHLAQLGEALTASLETAIRRSGSEGAAVSKPQAWPRDDSAAAPVAGRIAALASPRRPRVDAARSRDPAAPRRRAAEPKEAHGQVVAAILAARAK